jgi:hypothetical protein
VSNTTPAGGASPGSDGSVAPRSAAHAKNGFGGWMRSDQP